MQIIIEGKLPRLNDYINKERSNRYIAAKLKREATELVAWQCKKYAGKLNEEDYPLFMSLIWHIQPNRGKYPDPDNIAFSVKFILDGLVEAGVLPNDTKDYIESISHEFVWNSDKEQVILHLG